MKSIILDKFKKLYYIYIYFKKPNYLKTHVSL